MNILRYRAIYVLGLLVVVLLGACGGGGGGGGLPPGGGGATDTQAPSAEIIFPPAVSLTEGERVTVRGRAADNGTIAAVRVNGIEATSTDGFATWQAAVPLAPGPNTLTVETVDMASNVNPSAAEALINRDVLWAEPGIIALDSANNRALVVDPALEAIVAVDLTSGGRTILSGPTIPDSVRRFGIPRGIALDGANNRALVTDSGLDAVVAIDLASGARTIFSDASKPDGANSFSNPQAIALDSANNRALVVDSGLDAVVAVNLTTGARDMVSDASKPGDPFINPVGIAVDSANNRALVVDSGAVVEVDLITGARAIVSNASTPNDANPFINPLGIAIDSANNRALVTDFGLGAVVAVDLASGATGARRIVSNASTPNGANPFSVPFGIIIDSANNRALVVDFGLRAVVAVDLANGARAILSRASIPDGANPLIKPVGIALDSANNRALVVDSLVIDSVVDVVVAVDLVSGARAILSNASIPDGTNPFSSPRAIALDSANNRALVTDFRLQAIVAVDLSTGARAIVSDGNKPDGGANRFSVPESIALDSANNRALVVDSGRGAVVEVDLSTGARNILSNASIPDGTNPFGNPRAIALDSENNRALVVDFGLRAVVAVDLVSGARAILSDASTPNSANPFSQPQAITLDSANNRALVIDFRRLDAVVAVDLTTGVRTTLSDASTPNGANPFINPIGIAIDSANNRALVADDGWSGVLMVDLITGERVVFSK